MAMAQLHDSEPYSPVWYRTFMDTIPAAQTATEAAFLARQLPIAGYPRILDLCCGTGRHAALLTELGYAVTGVDRDAAAIAQARAASPATFMEADVRTVDLPANTWDATIIMWASFGYFAPEDNVLLLRRIARCLVPGGRLVLDVYNRDWLMTHQGERRHERAGLRITEHKQIAGERLTVTLHYDGLDVVDRFSWQIFTPAQLVETLAAAGFSPVTLCASFDERIPASAELARMQIVAELARPA